MTIAAPTSRAIPGIADDVPQIRRSILRRAWIFCRRQPLGTFGMAIVVIMALALSFLATLYPSWRAARLDPVEALRYE